MSVRLPPLEFTECITDSPYFRENLHKHEKELENTNHQIKRLIKEVKELLDAAKRMLLFIPGASYYYICYAVLYAIE